MAIPLTRPLLPPLQEFIPYLEQVWASGMLTNGGAMHQALEDALKQHLGVGHLALTSNGTMALLLALRVLGITGEVITTPYSFVATAHSLLWSGITPVFVDIDPVTLNMDPARIEAAITPRTSAIMPVHCYGTPCDTATIGRIARDHGLKVIYDAAHAFGVEDEGGSILRHGDLSILSFHATKVFNTFEGGAVVCHDEETATQLGRLRNFGFVNETTVSSIGINAKLNEVSAAFGLLQLRHIEQALERRRHVDAAYRQRLSGITGLRCLPSSAETRPNHAYFPILLNGDFPMTRDALYGLLRDREIMVRRYFHPLISAFPMYADLPSATPENLPAANAVSSQVLCLPIFPDMKDEEIDIITTFIREASGHHPASKLANQGSP